MGFLKDFRKNIMAPMGKPMSVMGVRPMLREPVLDMAGEKSIFGQRSPFGPPLQAPPAPSIGGMGGSNFGGPVGILPNEVAQAEKDFYANLQDTGPSTSFSQQPVAPLAPPFMPPKRNDFMSIAQDPNAIPLEDRQKLIEDIRGGIDIPQALQPRDPLRYDSVGMPLVDPINMPIDDGRRGRPGGPISITPDLLPPKRDDFMSIDRVGPTDDRARFPGQPLQATPAPVLPPVIPPPDFIGNPLLPPGGGRDPLRYDSIGMPLVDPINRPPSEGRSRPQPGEPGAPPLVPSTTRPSPPSTTGELPVQSGITAATPPVQPVNDVTTPTDPNMSVNMPVDPLNPVLLQQSASEVQTDPLLRSLYFGTQDSPGFYNQLQQAGANLIGQDVPLQQTAGLTPLELLARQQAVAGIGGFEPFFQQNKDLIDQAIGQSRRAEALRDPYFQRAERQMQIGLGNELTGIEEARGITAGATDRFGKSLGRLGRQQIGATGAFGQRMGDIEAGAAGATDQFGRSLDSTQAGLTGQVDQFGNRLTDVEGLQRGATDQFGQGIGASQIGLETGVDQFGNRLTDVEGLQRGSTDQFGRRSSDLTGRGISDVGRFEQGLTDVEGLQRGLTDQFGRRTSGIAGRGVSDVDMFSSGLQDTESLLRGTLGGYDQGLTQQFYNPYEDRVVQQTIDDVLKAGDKQDIASRAREISSGAFGGSRARLGAEERRESLGKGLAQALGNIRSQGYQSAQQTGLGEFARQKQAERAAASGLSDIASQRLGAGQNLSGMLANLSGQQLGAEQSLAGNLGSMASQRLGAGQQLTGMLRGLSSEQLAAQQSLASGLGSMAGQRLGATRGVEEFRRSGAGQQLGAQQALSDRLSNIAGQRLGAGQNLAEFQRGTAGQQLASQQALQNLLQSSAGQQLGAQQQLGSTLRGLTGDQFGAQQQLASNLMGYGSASNRARQNLSSGLLGIGQQRGAGAQQLGQSLAGFGQQIGGMGSSLDALRRGERSELAGYGGIGRGIAETGLGRIYEQQVGQQMRPLGVLGQIGSMLPGYQASSSRIDSQYGLPTDPTAAGLGAAFSAYGAMAPRQGQG